MTTLHCLLVRHTDHRRAVAALRDIPRVFTVAPVDEQVVQNALQLGWRDFEDTVQMAAAAAAGVEFMMTWNSKDFKRGSIPTLQPAEMLALIKPRCSGSNRLPPSPSLRSFRCLAAQQASFPSNTASGTHN